MPDAGTLGLFSLAALVLLVVPGPAVVYIVAQSVAGGRLAGVVSMLGIQAGGLVHVAAAALGLSSLLVSSATAFAAVKYLGAAYLVYLGLRRLLAREAAGAAAAGPPRPLARLFGQGVVVNVLNPKTALFFFAFLPQFVDPARGAVGLQIAVLGVVFILLAVLSDGAYALAAGTARSWIGARHGVRRAERVASGTVLVGLGVATALAGARKV